MLTTSRWPSHRRALAKSASAESDRHAESRLLSENRFSPFPLAGWGTLSWQGTMNSFFRELKGTHGRNNRGGIPIPNWKRK
jgi:hypothetical protein